MKLLALPVAVALLLVVAAPAAAQVTVNPHGVSYTASADHSALAVDGTTPLVSKYEFRVYLESAPGGAVQATPVDLGKPTPTTTGCPSAVPAPCIVINDTQVPGLFAGLAKNTKFIAKVVAVGPFGEGVSDPSNPFGFNGPPAKPGKPDIQK